MSTKNNRRFERLFVGVSSAFFILLLGATVVAQFPSTISEKVGIEKMQPIHTKKAPIPSSTE